LEPALKTAADRESPPPVARMVEDVIGCKWGLAVIDCARRGVARPCEMERVIGGISTKVLNERLRKLVNFEILAKQIYAEVPPRVEYRLTGFGQRFVDVLDHIATLESQRTQQAHR
jgi:DNA-binding HxlR family transcriptional regulator